MRVIQPAIARRRQALGHVAEHVAPDLFCGQLSGLRAGDRLDISREAFLQPGMVDRRIPAWPGGPSRGSSSSRASDRRCCCHARRRRGSRRRRSRASLPERAPCPSPVSMRMRTLLDRRSARSSLAPRVAEAVIQSRTRSRSSPVQSPAKLSSMVAPASRISLAASMFRIRPPPSPRRRTRRAWHWHGASRSCRQWISGSGSGRCLRGNRNRNPCRPA